MGTRRPLVPVRSAFESSVLTGSYDGCCYRTRDARIVHFRPPLSAFLPAAPSACTRVRCVGVYAAPTYLLSGNGVEGVDKRYFFVAAATSHARTGLAAPAGGASRTKGA